MHKHKKLFWGKLLLLLAIPLGTGAFAGWLVRDDIARFQATAQPPLSPPAWVFPIVWTILYILMGVASYLIATSASLKRHTALSVYFLQLLCNFFWPLAFFHLQAYLTAFLWLITLLLLVIYTTILFKEIRPVAGWLLVPYLVWLVFAAYLNFGVYLLNR